MKLTYFKKQWWMPVLFGLTLIIVALLKISDPSKGFIVIKMIIGWLIFTNGLGNTVFAIKNKKGNKNWFWYLFIGLIEISLGAIIVLYPTLFAGTFVFLIGIWLVFTAISRISYGISLKKKNAPYWWFFIISGVIIGFLSFIIIANPIFAKLYLIYLIATALILAGISAIRFGLEIRKMNEIPKEQNKALKPN